MGLLQPPHLAAWVWTVPFSLVAYWGNRGAFFSSPYLDISVQEVVFPPCGGMLHLAMQRVAPFGDRRIVGSCYLPDAIVQLETSFIVTCCQGIHYLLIASKLKLFIRPTYVVSIHFLRSQGDT